MPAVKSDKEYGFMKNKKPFKSIGPSPKVAKEFAGKKKRSIFMKGEENEVKRMKPPNNMLGTRG